MSQVIFKKKKSIDEAKQYVVKNCKKDFGMSLDMNIAFDADPPREVIFDLMEIISSNFELEKKKDESEKAGTEWDVYEDVNREEIDRRNKLYYNAASQLIFDTDLDGLSFDTAEDTEAAFENDKLPLTFLYRAVGEYIALLFQTHSELKKIMKRAAELETSGKNSEEKVEESPQQQKSD